MNPNLIAPCGMNCTLCIGYLREKNTCPGCREQGKVINAKTTYCRKCIIKNCEILRDNNWKFCSGKCEKYPCQRLKNLDRRYRTKYGMSMIENLEFIHEHGIRKFSRHEKTRWMKEGKVFCVHRKAWFEFVHKIKFDSDEKY